MGLRFWVSQSGKQEDNAITLEHGWKVDAAREMINSFDRVMKDIPAELEQKWEVLFQKLVS